MHLEGEGSACPLRQATGPAGDSRPRSRRGAGSRLKKFDNAMRPTICRRRREPINQAATFAGVALLSVERKVALAATLPKARYSISPYLPDKLRSLVGKLTSATTERGDQCCKLARRASLIRLQRQNPLKFRTIYHQVRLPGINFLLPPC